MLYFIYSSQLQMKWGRISIFILLTRNLNLLRELTILASVYMCVSARVYVRIYVYM